MSKQDIEKRLGFAAQGVKETTRTSAKAEMGFLSRVGYAATALTADPADPKSAEYRKQVSEAKAAAKDAITNYKFMRDKVKERLAALDAYVTNAIKVINSATSAKDIEHYVEQLRIAVKSQSMILGASKSPFSRSGAKMAFAATPAELKSWAQVLKKSIQASKKAEQQSPANSDEKYDYGVWKHGTMRLLSAVESGNRSQAKKELNDLQRSGFDVTNTQDIPAALRAWVSSTTASRPGAKGAFAASLSEIREWSQALKKEEQASRKTQKANERANSGEYDIDSATEVRVFSGLNAALQRGDKLLVRKLLDEAKREIDATVFRQGIPRELIAWANITTASRPGAKASTDFDLAEACWEGYEAVGTKKKDGKTVPNCVPKKKAARPGVKAKA